MQINKFSTTKLYNFSRYIIFILVISSFDKVKNKFIHKFYISFL